MSIYEILFLLTASAVLLLSIVGSNLRGAIWIAAIVADVLLSDAYVGAGLAYPEGVMAGLDFTVCLLIYLFAVRRWERWVFICMQLSMLVSIVDLTSNIIAPGWVSAEDYLLVLELVNYSAALLIGGVSGFATVGRLDASAFDPWRRVLPFGALLRRNGSPDGR